jgi:hypothetical protein
MAAPAQEIMDTPTYMSCMHRLAVAYILVYVGTLGREEVLAFSSTCLSFTSEQNGHCDLKVFQVWGLCDGQVLQAEVVSQSEIHCRLVSVHDQNVFSWKEVSLWWNKFKNCWTALNDDPEKQRGRPRRSHIDENCVIVRFDKENQRIKVCEVAEVAGIAKHRS